MKRNSINEKNIAETEAGYLKIYCWNRSRIDKKNIVEMEADWGKSIAEMEAG